MGDMFACMGCVIREVTSEFMSEVFFGCVYLRIIYPSNDVVEAAWGAGIGIHALIWVSSHQHGVARCTTNVCPVRLRWRR